MALCFNVAPRKNFKYSRTGQISLPVHVRRFVLLDFLSQKSIKKVTCFRDIMIIAF